MKHYTLLYIALFSSLLLTACKDNDDLTGIDNSLTAGEIIRVGGINTEELVATASMTRADEIDEETVLKTDAENISWLVEPLETGLDITYGLSSNRTGTSRVAVLKLLTTTGEVGGPIKYSVDGSNQYAEYSFLYRDNNTGEETSDPAIWYGNGAHFFEGLYIPERIQYNYTGTETAANVYDTDNGTAKKLTTDQHDDTETGTLGNYTLLSHYLGMPSNYTISATVARIKLPFRHRLARVLAYILIDPDMGTDLKINGYKSTADEIAADKDDPSTTAIKFCNVKVLAGVKDSYNSATRHHTYTPQWTEARKVIPHFVGERASYNDSTNTVMDATAFYSYYHISDKRYIYPDDSEWKTIHDKSSYFNETTNVSTDGVYQRIDYGTVPVYDLIVRPTYTSLANVMYDEEDVSTNRQNLYTATNQIDFELTLSNGLQYEKRFTFDLNANYQTVVYLHISKERVDYNSSGSELWVETKRDDDYYGVNNQNGNTLSYAGSSWQRAYTNSETNYNVTDGHQYQYDAEDRYAQYVTDDLWIEMLRQACEGGKHHGDYFILDRDISIPAAAFPENFVFTGHLDGQDHTITLTDASYAEAYDTYETWTTGAGTRYVKVSENNYVEFTPDANKTYCDANTGTPNVISDFSTYTGPVAYIRTEATPTYNLVSEAWKLTGGTYYKKNGNDYEEISVLTDYLNTFNNSIYTKNADTYTIVTDKNSLAANVTYYQLNGSSYESISNDVVNTIIGDIYTKNGETYPQVTNKNNLDANATFYKSNGSTYEELTDNEKSALTGNIYTKNDDSYTAVALADLSTTGKYYYLNGSTYVEISNIDQYIGVYNKIINYNYEEIQFYKFVHHASEIGTSTGILTDGYMFSGLNGKYSTAQESNASATWEANVHKETRNNNTYWVPYKTETDGWRAEVINLNVNGGTLFKSGASITGYVHNCWQGSTYSSVKWSGGTKVTEYTPAIPQY